QDPSQRRAGSTRGRRRDRSARENLHDDEGHVVHLSGVAPEPREPGADRTRDRLGGAPGRLPDHVPHPGLPPPPAPCLPPTPPPPSAPTRSACPGRSGPCVCSVYSVSSITPSGSPPSPISSIWSAAGS